LCGILGWISREFHPRKVLLKAVENEEETQPLPEGEAEEFYQKRRLFMPRTFFSGVPTGRVDKFDLRFSER